MNDSKVAYTTSLGSNHNPKLATNHSVPIYVCAIEGSDETGDGSLKTPFKTINEPIHRLGLVSHEDLLFRDNINNDYVCPSKASFKKAVKIVSEKKRKADSIIKTQSPTLDNATVNNGNESNPATSYKVLSVNLNLPTAIPTKPDAVPSYIGQRVTVSGWVSKLRLHSDLAFIVLRSGGDYVQCVASNDVANSAQVQSLSLETAVRIYGIVKKLPDGKKAPNGVEINVDFLELIGPSPRDKDSFSNKLNHLAGADILYDLRHLVIRGDVSSSILKFRSKVLHYFRCFFNDNALVEITAPTIVKTQTEGGSTLFNLKYYGSDAYLTQSSQFYLEAALPAVGDCYCIMPSYRAETSRTRRHLSEYTHLEAELGFISFDDLLNFIEKMVIYVVNALVNDPVSSEILKARNPNFEPPKSPFLRMTYKEAIQWLKENNVMKTVTLPDNTEKSEYYVYGDDIPESAERKLVDTIKLPILLNRFPADLKAFYMSKDPNDKLLTESCDLLLPNVGETVGGGMRITDYNEILTAYKTANVDHSDYYWYTDQRKYGTVPHGGFGLGIERLLAWMLDLYTVKMACLFPRVIDRCSP